MTRMAKDWKAVPEQKKCTTEENLLEEPVVIAPGKEEAVPVKADLCKDIKHIEHLQLHVRSSAHEDRILLASTN